jgi:hypothetical protein
MLGFSFARRTRERPHSDPSGLDDEEVTRPIITRSYQVGEPLSNIARPWHGQAQQDNLARARQR